MLNKSFFKFFFGFVTIVAMSFTIIVVASYFGGSDSGVESETILAN